MKRSIAIIAMTMMLSILFCNQASASGYIKGQLLVKAGKDYSGAVVTIFNGVNAEIVNTVTTDINGFFKSAPLQAGQYKVHFKSPPIIVNKDVLCVDEFFGQPDAHYAVFDTALDLTVVDNMDTDIGTNVLEPLSFCGPVLCVKVPGLLWGTVFDSSTLMPIPSIQVKFKDPITAFPKYDELTTDANGMFILDFSKGGCGPLEAKIRFYDPNGIYRPEYYGAGGIDSFTQGKDVIFSDIKVEIKEDLAKVPPAEQIVNIIGDIQTILPPQDAQRVVASLQQAEALLTDANPNNDKGACGILTGSANKMKGLVSSGRLSQADADALTASMDALKNDLGCK